MRWKPLLPKSRPQDMAARRAAPRAALLIGTADTKSDELTARRSPLREVGHCSLRAHRGGGGEGAGDGRRRAGARHRLPLTSPTAEVAAAAGQHDCKPPRTRGDENAAMTRMAQGAAPWPRSCSAEGRIDGLLALGGTMGTDLALDVAAALPLGVPKVVVSTIAYSHLLPPERITPDLIMVLWSGGLYGLNSLCRSALAQAPARWSAPA
jgi:uncharacterized protein (UPF0261 family)